MIEEKTIWDEVWPVVEELIEATLAEDAATMRTLFTPDGQAAAMLDLFDVYVYDILLKTVLGREQLGVSRAVETDNGRFIHIEYAWPEPGSDQNSFTANDVVTASLTQIDGRWLIDSINPSTLDLPLTGARARGLIATGQSLSEDGKVPGESWILPFALYGGLLKMKLRPEALADPVEALLIPGMQERTYGAMALVNGRTLWRDFKTINKPDLDKPAAWAAAVEFIMSELELRSLTQAAVAKNHQIPLSLMVPRMKQIKKVLNIQKNDDRYADLHSTQIIYE
ncbi:MAG: hypothetical protein IPM53_26465 [Anaerolineaceae bacterium]|nr:hypothetical protein [Anaerolineaceae bacterium]